MAKAIQSSVTLELTAKEARVLLYICNNIGGPAATSCRGDVDAIGSALQAAGVTSPSSQFDTPLHSGDFTFLKGSIDNLYPERT